MSKPQAVGIAWYVRETYEQALEMMSDAAFMPETFDEWRERAEEVVGQLQARGFRIERVRLDPPTFVAWCARRAIPPDSEARCAYAAEVAEQVEADKRPIRVDLRSA